MDEQKNDTVVEEAEEAETPEADLTPETDWEAEAIKARGIAQRLRTKLTKATEKKRVETVAEPVREVVRNTGELDETQLDYLDLKGINDDDDIKLIEGIVKKTGQTVRQVLKDDYVKTKLESSKTAREVKNATPSNTKRAGSGATDSLELAIAKYEQSGGKDLPEDFDLRTKVVNAVVEKGNPNKPSWR